MAVRGVTWLFGLSLLAGCQQPGYDRLPATAVDNPDPLLGSSLRSRTEPSAEGSPEKSEAVAATPTSPLTPAAARTPDNPDRIGPLTFRPRSSPPPGNPAQDPISPGPATLALGAREPKPEPAADQNVRPASTFIPVSNPEVVQGYRKRLKDLGAAAIKTRPLDGGLWEAVVHLPLAAQPDQLRRIEAQGVSEADALLAIVEQLERQQ